MELDFYEKKTEGENSKSDAITISDEDLAAILSAEHSFHLDEGINFDQDSTDFIGMLLTILFNARDNLNRRA